MLSSQKKVEREAVIFLPPPLFFRYLLQKRSFLFCVWEANVSASAAIMPSSAWPQGTKRGGGGGGFRMVIVGKGFPNPLVLCLST